VVSDKKATQDIVFQKFAIWAPVDTLGPLKEVFVKEAGCFLIVLKSEAVNLFKYYK
jgi:hypothetical protein